VEEECGLRVGKLKAVKGIDRVELELVELGIDNLRS
jgi:hypothetical protein